MSRSVISFEDCYHTPSPPPKKKGGRSEHFQSGAVLSRERQTATLTEKHPPTKKKRVVGRVLCCLGAACLFLFCVVVNIAQRGMPWRCCRVELTAQAPLIYCPFSLCSDTAGSPQCYGHQRRSSYTKPKMASNCLFQSGKVCGKTLRMQSHRQS